MVVTCPNCRSRYAVDPLKIGSAGRTVECARCHHQWHQKVDDASPVPELVIRPTTTGASLPAVIPPKPAFPWRRAVVVGVVVALLIAAVLFAFRARIATMISDDAGVSTPVQVATATTTPAPSRTVAPEATPRSQAAPEARPQIEVDLTTSSVEAVDGHFVVRGQLVNNGRAPGSTTLLRLTFKRNEDVLGERSFPMVEGPLPPGGRATFSQPLENPPSGTTDIVPAVE
ncbi:MAG: zinc-ribbon domain-containing protein [Proteobacteria bacterium]|nr:zinc-ribbon domain-containing protein [Pseudomonadota bacterium]